MGSYEGQFERTPKTDPFAGLSGYGGEVLSNRSEAYNQVFRVADATGKTVPTDAAQNTYTFPPGSTAAGMRLDVSRDGVTVFGRDGQKLDPTSRNEDLGTVDYPGGIKVYTKNGTVMGPDGTVIRYNKDGSITDVRDPGTPLPEKTPDHIPVGDGAINRRPNADMYNMNDKQRTAVRFNFDGRVLVTTTNGTGDDFVRSFSSRSNPGHVEFSNGVVVDYTDQTSGTLRYNGHSFEFKDGRFLSADGNKIPPYKRN
jgi:hypothetical protein